MVEYCLHFANCLYLLSFLAWEILWLRVLTCAGLLLGMVFFSCRSAPMYGPALWHLIFLLINLVQIARLVNERRRMTLTDEQRALAETAFNDLSREEMLTLLTRAVCGPTECLPNLRRAARLPLSEEEQLVRNLAFRDMSRSEIVHLLVRRLWNPIRWMNPSRWHRRRAASPSIINPTPIGLPDLNQ